MTRQERRILIELAKVRFGMNFHAESFIWWCCQKPESWEMGDSHRAYFWSLAWKYRAQLSEHAGKAAEEKRVWVQQWYESSRADAARRKVEEDAHRDQGATIAAPAPKAAAPAVVESLPLFEEMV